MVLNVKRSTNMIEFFIGGLVRPVRYIECQLLDAMFALFAAGQATIAKNAEKITFLQLGFRR